METNCTSGLTKPYRNLRQSNVGYLIRFLSREAGSSAGSNLYWRRAYSKITFNGILAPADCGEMNDTTQQKPVTTNWMTEERSNEKGFLIGITVKVEHKYITEK